ncbi:MAG: FecR family protein [Spirochaetota bacterium]
MRRAIIWFLLVAAAAAGFADDGVGTVSYVEGFPEIVREGTDVYEEIDFGFRIENFDVVRTDERSALEIDFDPATGVDASVSVEPDTHFAVELSSLRTEQTGAIELIAGSVSVTARRLTGRSRFEIRTPAAIMGVRGTVFDVSGAPGGELLVTTEEGLVEVTDPTGRSLFASPGEAVEVDEASSLFRSVRYERAQLAAFRREWRAERLERFIDNAPRILSFHGRRYLSAREDFVTAYADLMSHRDLIDEWTEEARRGVRPRARSLRERRELVAALRSVRIALFRLEPVMARLDAMAPYVREFVSTVEIEPGVTGAELYRTVNNDRRLMRERVAEVRRVLKLFALRNGGETPFDFMERVRDRIEERREDE